MPDSSYEVAAVLSVAMFDDRRDAMRLVRRVVVEARRLRSLDERLARVVVRRRRRQSTVELSVELRASWAAGAFDFGRAVMREAVHAAGGATAGWEELRPEIRQPRPGRRGTPAASVGAPAGPPGPIGWASRSAHAQRRAMEDPPLPPFTGALHPRALPPLPGSPVSSSPFGELLIDLR